MITQPKLSVWEKVIHTALDLVFPPACAGCKAPGKLICQTCAKKAYYKGSECLFCATRAEASHICKECKAGRPLESVLWPWRYNVEEARTIIAAYKYRKRRALARALADELSGVLRAASLPDNLIAIPVPLHPKREKERGFNQAELLAKCLGMPVLRNVVIRTKETPPQARAASRREREKQIKGAFAVARPKLITGKNILIVDDVATTGATIVELARALKKSGAREIHAAVIAHG